MPPVFLIMAICAVAGVAAGTFLLLGKNERETPATARFAGAIIAAFLAPALLLAIGNSTIESITSQSEHAISSLFFLLGVALVLGVYSENLFARITYYMDRRFDEFLKRSGPYKEIREDLELVENVIEEGGFLEEDGVFSDDECEVNDAVLSEELNETQQKLLQELRSSTVALRSLKGLSQAIGEEEANVAMALERLRDLKLIKSIETGKGIRWRLIQPRRLSKTLAQSTT